MSSKKETWKEGMYGDEVREKLLEFAERGWESIPEDERDMWFSRFKFWGVFHQRSGQESYFMLRLTNANGQLNAEQLRAIGEVARDYATGPVENPEFGDAWIDLTTRQSIQLHWINLEDVPAIWEKLESVGVTTRSSGGDTMRNIVGCPVAGKDEEQVIETQSLLERLQEDLRGDDELANMPRKFNISVTGCREGCAQDAINGIGLEPAEKEIAGEVVTGFNVRIGGGLGGREPRKARDLDVFVTRENAYHVIRGFVELYYEHGRRDNRQKNRSRFFVDDEGTAAIRERLQEEYVDVDLRRAGRNVREEYTYNAGRPPEAGKSDHVGVHDQPDGRKYVGLSVPVGRMTARETIALADVAEAYGSGKIRLTRRQNPLIMDVEEEALEDLLAEPLLETHQPNPTPFDRGGMACTGTEFCDIALTETKLRLTRILRWLNANVEVPDDVETIKIHYSGCTADCGHAYTADIGLQGMRAQKDGDIVEALDIGVGGGLGPHPGFVEWVSQRVPADEVPGAIRSLIGAFAAHREEGQTFREWVESFGTESVVDLCEPTETTYEDPYMHDAKQTWYPFAEGESPAPTTVDDVPITSD
ncbi:nitrite/sulfite reductase [Haloplanus salinarum]|uniref:nitrite/sulfite reductase n=1 Tax=Haloplanus salinarum TaxID=1912324 RepID=UPI00214C0AD1|nr:ferredoxin--nitrite reductase [Haloplanus salinarum]